GPPIAGDEANEPQPGREVDLVQGPLAEIADVDPVALLRCEDRDVERAVVHPDPAVAAASDALDVTGHPLLEVAGRGPHRRPLGLLDRREGELVHPDPALERDQVLARSRQALGLGRDLLRVDLVRLDARASSGLVVPCSIDGSLLVAHLDLEALPGAWLAGDRTELLERVGLLFDLERGGVPERREGLGRLLADEP